jgi:hypothetical protein
LVNASWHFSSHAQMFSLSCCRRGWTILAKFGIIIIIIINSLIKRFAVTKLNYTLKLEMTKNF